MHSKETTLSMRPVQSENTHCGPGPKFLFILVPWGTDGKQNHAEEKTEETTEVTPPSWRQGMISPLPLLLSVNLSCRRCHSILISPFHIEPTYHVSLLVVLILDNEDHVESGQDSRHEVDVLLAFRFIPAPEDRVCSCQHGAARV